MHETNAGLIILKNVIRKQEPGSETLREQSGLEVRNFNPSATRNVTKKNLEKTLGSRETTVYSIDHTDN